MFSRVLVIAMNAYRESVRARLLLALFGLALATSGYSVVVASLSLHQEARVVSDLASGSIALYAAAVAILLGATSLHREVEQKTIFPILARPLGRHEYLLGKFFGAMASLVVFIATDAALVLGILALLTGQKPALVGGVAGSALLALGLGLWRLKHTRVYFVVPWSLVVLAAMAWVASTASDDRRLVLASIALTVCESAIVTAVATLFSSFSSPLLTAVFSLGVFLIGRSADTLANLPVRQVGATLRTFGAGLARVVPNLHLYVPPRPVLLGQVADLPIWPYVARASGHAIAYSAALLALAWIFFRKRDFT